MKDTPYTTSELKPNTHPVNDKHSNCCGANDIYDGNLDNNEGVCADCGEHCEMEWMGELQGVIYDN